MFKPTKLAVFMLILCLSLLTAACGQGAGASGNAGAASGGQKAQDKVVIKFAHEETETDLQGKYVAKFKELIEARKDVNVEVEIFPVGTLGNDLGIAEQLQQGAIQMAITSPGTTGSLIPEAQFAALKFLFSDDRDVNNKVLNTSKALNEILAAEYLKHDMKVLHFWQEGFNSWTANRAIHAPEDLKGFKIRTQTSPLMVKAYEAMGANPTALDWSEVFSAIQLGTIDGQENPDFWIHSSGVYELQKYLILSAHSIYITSAVAHEQFFESQTPEVQKAILETIEQLRPYAAEIEKDMNGKAVQAMKDSGKTEVITLTPEERAKFRSVSEGSYKDYVAISGGKSQEIIDLLSKEIADAQASK